MDEERDRVIRELMTIPTVSEKAAEGMYLLGVRSTDDLKERDPMAMYEELRGRNDFFAEPCMINMLRMAVGMAKRRE